MASVLLATATATARPQLLLEPFDIVLHLQPADNDGAALEQVFWQVSDPRHAQYARYRSRNDLRALLGASNTTLAAATDWLRSLGAQAVAASPLHHTLTGSFAAGVPHAHRWSARGLPTAARPAGIALVTRRTAGVQPDTPAPPAVVGRADLGSYTIKKMKAAFGIPDDLTCTHEATTQMVWGPGTFGYSPSRLAAFKSSECPLLNLSKVQFDTANHGRPGGDNFGEGELDTRMTAAFGLNATTLVSNTNASSSTEEGDGFGLAFLDFVTDLAARDTVPHVLSLSLGSLSAFSCDLLCEKAAAEEGVTKESCEAYLQTQRQVCMFTSVAQVGAINRALQALGLRGVSVLGASGDGGSHWSFGPFPGIGPVARALNKVGCESMFPIFPSPSPYMTSVGGSDWAGFPPDPTRPVAWSGSGGGFAWQFPRPAHQAAAVDAYLASTAGLPPASSFNATGAAYPDIAAVSVEGTSQSSPMFAGIFTLLTDARLNAGLPPLGFLGPRIWQVAAAHPGEAFEDITEGNSKTSCDNGFPATTGWDPVTGWGRPVWSGLAKHFAAAP